MKKPIQVAGPWQVMYCEPNLGPTAGCSALELSQRWLPAEVPGDVHLDLQRAGQIENPFFGLNSDHCRWMEEMDWWYRTEFDAPMVAQNQRLHLIFEGLDVFATVRINGKVVGQHANMFTSLRLDVTDVLIAGKNLMEVCLGAPAFPPGRAHVPQVRGYGNPLRLHVRKAQASYGWNIAPRLVTIGIWKPVWFALVNSVEIDSVHVRTIRLESDHAELEATVELQRNFGRPTRARCELRIAGQRFQFELPCDEHSGRATVRITVPAPELWWPRNHGQPTLYPWSASLWVGTTEVDAKSGHFGIRTVTLVQEEESGDGCSFRLHINGKPIFLKGINWTPADAIFARVTTDRYRQLLEAATGVHINALRVWGGGTYEGSAFYSLCDELGLVVLHDFMFACGCYPQDREFFDEVRREATEVVRRLRNHPCLCGWFGDNENDVVAEVSLHAPDYKRSALNKSVLREVVAQHAPGTPYVPTSPFSPTFADQNSDKQGDCHLWAHGLSYRNAFYTDKSPRMITEIGHLGMPPIEVIEAFVSPERLWPVWNEEWLVHGADCSRLDRIGRYRTLWQSIEARGWPAPENLGDLIRMTQQLQAEATEYWITLYGNQPQCWGIFLWNLADCWPQMSDAYIAYPFFPKPAFEAIRSGFGRLTR